MSFHPLPLIIVGAYLLFLGWTVLRLGGLREHTLEEFTVASRSFSWYWVLFTVVATWFPGSVFTGWFGWAATDGLIALYGPIYTVTGLVLFYLLAPRVWVWGKVHGLYNMPDFVRLRYNSKTLGFVFAFVSVVIAMPGQVMAFKTFGYITSAVTAGAVPFNLGMLIAVVICMGYIVYGGMRSVVVTDFMQGIISTVIVIGGMVFVIYKLFGGFGPLLARLSQEAPRLLTVPAEQVPYWSSIILTGTIGAFCWLEMFNRIFVAKSARELKIVAGGAPLLAGGFFILLLVLGLGGGLLPEVLANVESGFFTMFYMAGGPWLLGLAAIVVLAAEMSALDSAVSSSAIVLTQNVLGHFWPMTDQQAIKATRWVISVFTIIAYIAATQELPLLVFILIFMYEFLIHLFPGIIVGAFWRRANTTSVLSGMVIGMAVTTFLMIQAGDPMLASGWTAGIIGFAVNVAVFVAVSLLTPPSPHVAQLFGELDRWAG